MLRYRDVQMVGVLMVVGCMVYFGDLCTAEDMDGLGMRTVRRGFKNYGLQTARGFGKRGQEDNMVSVDADWLRALLQRVNSLPSMDREEVAGVYDPRFRRSAADIRPLYPVDHVQDKRPGQAADSKNK